MTRDDLMARMSGQEYAAWMALFRIKGQEAEDAKTAAEASDGIAIISGRDEPDTDEDETDIDEVIDERGETE